MIQSRRCLAFQQLPERLRVIRHLAIAISARDDGNSLFFREIDFGMIFHAQRAGGEPVLPGLFGQATGQRLRRARLRAEKEQ